MNITLEYRSLAILMTVGGIKIIYSSILLTIKLENLQDSEKIYELTTGQNELLY